MTLNATGPFGPVFFARNAGRPVNIGSYFRYNAIADAVIGHYISAL